ncbi:MAG TPA: Spy/CpxP family protein refolding chaperone [Burkholderiales bacterium]
MSLSKKTLGAFLVASSLALGVAHAASGHSHHHPHRGGAMASLRGLDLTEAQRDQLFKILHEQAPAKREHMKRLREARRSLAEAARAERYDAERVRAAAEAQGKAVAELALLRAQTMQRVHALLTPEQRARLKERLEKRRR